MDPLDNLDQLDQMDLQVTEAHLAFLVPQVQSELGDHRGPRENEVTPVFQGKKALKDLLDCRAQLDLWAHEENEVKRAVLASLDLLDLVDDQETRVHQGQLETWDHLELLAYLGLQARPDLLDLLEKGVSGVLLDRQVLSVLLA